MLSKVDAVRWFRLLRLLVWTVAFEVVATATNIASAAVVAIVSPRRAGSCLFIRGPRGKAAWNEGLPESCARAGTRSGVAGLTTALL